LSRLLEKVQKYKEKYYQRVGKKRYERKKNAAKGVVEPL
jgi:hypothetical protein